MSAQQRPPLACVYCRQITGHAPTCITYVAAALERVRQTQQPADLVQGDAKLRGNSGDADATENHMNGGGDA